MKPLLEQIPQFNSWKKWKSITKGWSYDKKFYLETYSNEKMLLRISHIADYQVKKRDYEYIQQLVKRDISMAQPIAFGKAKDNTFTYTLFSWIEGKDAEDHIHNYNVEKQYALGREAGAILRKIHSISAPHDQESWKKRYMRKILQRIDQYHAHDVQLPQGDAVIAFLQKHLDWVVDRPQVVQHGDFHLGNLIIRDDHSLGLIDFNRMQFGDPWEEFDRAIFNWRQSIPFMNGQIHEYFQNDVPHYFFQLLAVYTALNIISSIPWAIPFGSSEVATMKIIAQQIIESYHGFDRIIPTWYKLPHEYPH